MHFLSVKEFFYKVNTIGFILLLLPVIVFLLVHVAALKSFPTIIDARQTNMLLVTTCTAVAFVLTIVKFFWHSRMKLLKAKGELSKKMEGYFVLVAVRNGSYSAALLLLSAGYYVTHSIYFSGAYLVVLLVLLAQWPGPARFCQEFELRSDERDMILHNQDLVVKKKKPGR